MGEVIDIPRYNIIEELSNGINSVSFDPKYLVIATGSNNTKLWDMIPDSTIVNCLKTFEEHNSYILSIAFHPRRRILATGSSDNTVKLLSINEFYNGGDIISTLAEHT